MKIVTKGFGDKEVNRIYIPLYGLGGVIAEEALINAASQIVNLKRSLEKYIYDNLYTTEGLNIDYHGLPFETTRFKEWIEPRIVYIEREYYKSASATQYGSNLNFIFNINIFVKKSGITTAHRHYQIRDIISDYFRIGEDIDFKDYYDTNATLCNIRIRSMIDDKAEVEEQEYLKYKVSWLLNYLEKTDDP